MSNPISIAPDGDARWKVHSPFTGPDSEHRVVHESELEKFCNFHKEVAAARSNYRDLWLTSLSATIGHFISSGTSSFSGQRPFMDALMASGAFFSGILFYKAFREERACSERCDAAVKQLRESITSRVVNNANAQAPKNSSGKKRQKG